MAELTWKGLGTLFYAVNPYETMYKTVADLPTPDWTAKVRKFIMLSLL